MEPGARPFPQQLPCDITRSASRQSYWTIRLLADRNHRVDAFRIYAYFRWLDDTLDEALRGPSTRAAFVARESALIRSAYAGTFAHDAIPEEQMVLDLIRDDGDARSGLHLCLTSMLEVMRFDAERRGRLITQQELDGYTHHLAVAVTEALHYCIGHGQFAPYDDTRYCAVAAAHITHMLRDAVEDHASGYINCPGEFLAQQQIASDAFARSAYKEWVKGRVAQARHGFDIGRQCLARVECARCRLAGHAYIARFEWVLDVIEREGYQLRGSYAERKRNRAALQIGGAAFKSLLAANLAHARSASSATLERGAS